MTNTGHSVSVLFVIDSLRFGGAERQLAELVKGLDHRRFAVTVVSLRREDQSYAHIIEAQGVELIYLERAARFDISPIFRLVRLIKSRRIQVVHAMLSLGGVFGVAAAKLAGVPVVCSVIREGKDPNMKLRLYRKMLAPFSDLYVSNSRAGLMNRFKRLRPNFRVVYNGFDLARFSPLTNECRDRLRGELGIPIEARLVGMVASLSPYKDQETLLRSIAAFRRECQGVHLMFVGDGTERGRLEGIVTELGLGDIVHFLGYRSDVDQLVQILDVSVLLSNPTKHLEGISNSLAEAMANRIPVVGSRGGGTDELIVDGETGLLVDPLCPEQVVDALRRILGDPEFAKRLGASAAKRIQGDFSLKTYVDTYSEYYVALSGAQEA